MQCWEESSQHVLHVYGMYYNHGEVRVTHYYTNGIKVHLH